MRSIRLSHVLAGCSLVATAFVGFACTSGDDATEGDEADLTAACKSAKIDDGGFCRAKNGQFAKATCCAPADACSTAAADSKGVCRRSNGQFAPTACCAAVCGGASLDENGYCRAENGRFALAECCNDPCATAKDPKSIPACNGTDGTVTSIADAVGELEKIFADGRDGETTVTSTTPLEMIKEYIAAEYEDLADGFEYSENAPGLETDTETAGTITTKVASGEVDGALVNISDDSWAGSHVDAQNAIDAIAKAGGTFGFDGFNQNGCAAPTPMLLVLDPKTKTVYSIDLSPCEE